MESQIPICLIDENYNFLDIFPQTAQIRKRLWIYSLARKNSEDIQPIVSSQSVYYTDIKETKILGEGRAMGINGVYENIAQMIGPIIFGGALLLGYKKGIMLIVSIVTGLLLLFIISSRANRSNSKSAVTSGQREAEIK